MQHPSTPDPLDQAAPAAPAPAPRLAALKVQKPGASELNPAQRRFNRLLAQVDKLGQQRAHIEHLATVLRAPHLERITDLEGQVRQVQTAMVLFLHERLQRKGLTSTQQKSARAVLMPLLRSLLEQGDDNPQLQPLQAEYLGSETPQPSDAQALRQDALETIAELEAALGISLNLGDPEQYDSPEQLMALAMKRLQEHAHAEKAQAAARQAQRKPTAKQKKAQEEAQDAKSAMRTIYRQLASALHPDRETDPAEHQRKSALMGQANAAYERGDLGTLLRLQLQAQQVDAGSIARMADDKLAALSRLLKDQVTLLEQELFQAEMRLGDELDIVVRATFPMKHVQAQLRGVQERLERLVAMMQRDLERVQDDAELKRWLREQAALDREHARRMALQQQFFQLDPEDFFD